MATSSTSNTGGVAAPHRWIGPVPAGAERCECSLCARHDEAMARHERALTEPVELLLAAGWFPHEIVDVVATGSPKSSRAPLLVRLALVAIAAEHVADPVKRMFVSQVRELSGRTGFRVESIGPGWFEQWYWAGRRGVKESQLWTRHAVTILEPIIAFGDLGTTAESQSKFHIGRPRVDEIRRTLHRRMPEPHDRRWTSAYDSL